MTTKERVEAMVNRDVAKVCDKMNGARLTHIYAEMQRVTGFSLVKCIKLTKAHLKLK